MYKQIMPTNTNVNKINDASDYLKSRCGCEIVTTKLRKIPYIDSCVGESKPQFLPFRNFTIVKNDCCDLTVITDGGEIFIPANIDCYSSIDFDCDISSIEIMGDCVADTIIYVNGYKYEYVQISEQSDNYSNDHDCGCNCNCNCNSQCNKCGG